MGHMRLYAAYQALTFLFAQIWGLSRTLTFNKAFVEPHYFFWSKFKIIAVFGGPTLLLLLTGLIAGRISTAAVKKNVIHYFLHWFSISAPLLLAGQFIVNFFYRITLQDTMYLGISNISEG